MNVNGIFTHDIEPTKVLAGCVHIYENAITNQKDIIKNLEAVIADRKYNLQWSKARTVGQGENQNVRTNYNIGLTEAVALTDDEELKKIHNQFYKLLLDVSIPYARKYGIDESIFFEGYNVLKYSGGQQYHAHYDGGPSSRRYMSPILYLNDEYDGGEIEFVNFGLKIKPKAGTLMLFPANYAYTHIAHPVTQGTKYAIVTWVRDIEIERV